MRSARVRGPLAHAGPICATAYDRRMQKAGITREVASDGTVWLKSNRCSYSFRLLRPGVLLVTLAGIDDGQFGSMALDEIRVHLLEHRPLQLFVDAEAAIAVMVEVSREWTHFFTSNRQRLKRVSALPGTRAVELTMAIAQHLSQTGNLLQIYTDRALFTERMADR